MRTLSSCLAAGLFFALPAATFAPALGDKPPAPAPESAIEVQARGPVHEAFAQPVQFKPEPTPAVPNQPPAPIPEEPPAQKPEGENVQWIGGYWAWDADRNEFLWISGVWRDAPPGRRYVAGYWENTPDGWRWVPGFWAPEGQSELPYVPPPPEPPSLGPSLPPPDNNSCYVPGVWLYRGTHHLWQPGYWMACQPGQVWIPAHYAWTPGGCVFVSGYWDRALHRRGLLFPPVAFRRPLWQQAGWAFCPGHAVRSSALLDALFVSPASKHYYFGDYYARGYANQGIRPWVAYGPANNDPLYGYYRWANRNEAGWQTGLKQTYQDRVAGRAPLPPRTLAQQTVALNQPSGNKGKNAPQVVAPLGQLREPSVRLSAVSASQLAAERAKADRGREIANTRQRTEKALAGRPPEGKGGVPAVKALRLPASGGAPQGKEQNLAGKVDPAPRIKSQPSVNKAPPAAVKGPSFAPAVVPKTPAAHPKANPPKVAIERPRAPAVQAKPPAPAPKAIEVRPPAVQPRVTIERPRPPAAQPKAFHPAPAPRVAPNPRPAAVQSPRPPAVQHRPPAAHGGGGGGGHRR